MENNNTDIRSTDADIEFMYKAEHPSTALPEQSKEEGNSVEGFTKGEWEFRETGNTRNAAGEKTQVSITITKKGDSGWYGKSIAVIQSKGGDELDKVRYSIEECEANAQRIVNCVNAYDGLVSTLNGLLNEDRVIWAAKLSGPNSIFNDNLKAAKELIQTLSNNK